MVLEQDVIECFGSIACVIKCKLTLDLQGAIGCPMTRLTAEVTGLKRAITRPVSVLVALEAGHVCVDD